MLQDPWRFPRPEAATHYAELLADAPRRPLAIFGPRQIGKTHFLTHDLTEAAESRGWCVVDADLWGQADSLGAINTALAALLRTIQTRAGRTSVTNVGALGVSVGMAAPVPLAAHMDFPLLGKAFVTFIAARIKRISQRNIPVVDLDWAFSQLLHRPGEMIDFARFMVTEVPGTDVHGALETFKLRNQPDVGFEVLYADCTPLQQALLLEVASCAKLFARDTRERLGTFVGQTAAVPPASVHNTLAQLEAKGLLVKRETRGHCEFEDDHLRNWIDRVARMARASGKRM